MKVLGFVRSVAALVGVTSAFRVCLFALAMIILVMIISVSPALVKAAPERYRLDPAHLTVAFMVHHIGYAETLGVFRQVEGGFLFDETTRSLSDLTVTIEAASVDSFHEKRDQHLRSKDFLHVEAYPQITFVMTGSEPRGEREGRIVGDLTLRGVTKPVTLDVTWNKSAAYPFGKNYVLGASARAVIQRSDFGMSYAVENGWVGDEVEIIIEIEAIRQ